MSAKHENATIVGVGAAACVVCCAGPILAVLAAIGLGTAAGLALFGIFAVLVGAVVTVFVIMRRRRTLACAPAESPVAVPVEFSDMW